MSRPASTTLTLPAESGGRRRISLRVSAEGVCRVCGEPILRVANGQDDWVHRARIEGGAISHVARPRSAGRNLKMASQTAETAPGMRGEPAEPWETI